MLQAIRDNAMAKLSGQNKRLLVKKDYLSLVSNSH